MQTRNWFFSSYRNIGVDFNLYNRNRATVLTAPVGWQLNRRLNDNLYAFTGLLLSPTYVNFNRSFVSPGIKSIKGNSFNPGYFGVYPSVNMGMMYVNDARTFSVSGSVSVQRSNYPILFYSPANLQGINSFTPTAVYR